jgi:hypothetical protein
VQRQAHGTRPTTHGYAHHTGTSRGAWSWSQAGAATSSAGTPRWRPGPSGRCPGCAGTAPEPHGRHTHTHTNTRLQPTRAARCTPGRHAVRVRPTRPAGLLYRRQQPTDLKVRQALLLHRSGDVVLASSHINDGKVHDEVESGLHMRLRVGQLLAEDDKVRRVRVAICHRAAHIVVTGPPQPQQGQPHSAQRLLHASAAATQPGALTRTHAHTLQCTSVLARWRTSRAWPPRGTHQST